MYEKPLHTAKTQYLQTEPDTAHTHELPFQKVSLENMLYIHLGVKDARNNV
jgi:hypothetical protein